MNRILSLRNALFLALACVLVAGCGKKAPEDMPETVPFKVKVVKGSASVADVQVVMEAADGKGVGSVAGTTNGSGVAEMKTTYKNYTAKGVPAGEYKVRLIKDPVVDHWKTEAELNAMDMGTRQAYFDEWTAKCEELPREVPVILKDYDKSPLSTTVPGEGQYVVDCAEYEN